jgi:superfamily I DNA/RNA helicase
VWKYVVKNLGFDPTPSEQQAAVWEALSESGSPRTIAYCAFNKSIVREFGHKYKWLVDALRTHANCTLSFSTTHSLGFQACCRAYRISANAINKYKVPNIMERILNADLRKLRKEKPLFVTGTQKLVDFLRVSLLEPTEDNMSDVVHRQGLDLGWYRDDVYALVPQVIEACKNDTRVIDFADMIWMPSVHNLPVPKVDLLLGDEVQDWNICQQNLAQKAGDRLALCGDTKQAIYAFAGADSKSMERLKTTMGEKKPGVALLPLNVTRRCGKAIVSEAQKIVPDFYAHEDNPEGEVLSMDSVDAEKELREGDMVLCRMNAPLVALVFRLLRKNVKATIQGRDVGENLLSFVHDIIRPRDIEDCLERLDDYLTREVDRINNSKNPDEDKIAMIQDQVACIKTFCEGLTTLPELKQRIESIFTDEQKPGVRLSSIHKAKGLEADRVYLFSPELCPHPAAMKRGTEEAIEQEWHLKYVAITRAIHRFVYAISPKKGAA